MRDIARKSSPGGPHHSLQCGSPGLHSSRTPRFTLIDESKNNACRPATRCHGASELVSGSSTVRDQTGRDRTSEALVVELSRGLGEKFSFSALLAGVNHERTVGGISDDVTGLGDAIVLAEDLQPSTGAFAGMPNATNAQASISRTQEVNGSISCRPSSTTSTTRSPCAPRGRSRCRATLMTSCSSRPSTLYA